MKRAGRRCEETGREVDAVADGRVVDGSEWVGVSCMASRRSAGSSESSRAGEAESRADSTVCGWCEGEVRTGGEPATSGGERVGGGEMWRMTEGVVGTTRPGYALAVGGVETRGWRAQVQWRRR